MFEWRELNNKILILSASSRRTEYYTMLYNISFFVTKRSSLPSVLHSVKQ